MGLVGLLGKGGERGGMEKVWGCGLLIDGRLQAKDLFCGLSVFFFL
jgi:hypothetical protein